MTRITRLMQLALATGLMGTVLGTSFALAQGPSLVVNARGAPFALGGAGAWTNSTGWMNDENLLDELEIIAEQREKLQSLRAEALQRRRDFFDSYRSVPAEKRAEFMKDFGEFLSSDVEEKIDKILLPHQKKRLEQIQLQTRMRNTGIAGLDRDLLIKELGITDQQLELLRNKQKEVQEHLRKELERLRREAQDELLSVLTEAQQKKIRTMMGKDYEFKPRRSAPPPKAPAATPVRK